MRTTLSHHFRSSLEEPWLDLNCVHDGMKELLLSTELVKVMKST